MADTSAGDRIASCYTRKKYEVTELGIMHPEEVPTSELRPGQVGFVACSMKESSEGQRIFPFEPPHIGAEHFISPYWRYPPSRGRTGGSNAWVQARKSDGTADDHRP